MSEQKNNSTQKPKKFTTSPTQPTQPGTQRNSSGGQNKKKRNRRRKKNRNGGLKKFSAPTNTYLSKCCSEPAKKPRTGNATGEVREGSKVTDPTLVTGLGGWRCTKCGKPCKVNRSKIVVEVANVPIDSGVLPTPDGSGN